MSGCEVHGDREVTDAQRFAVLDGAHVGNGREVVVLWSEAELGVVLGGTTTLQRALRRRTRGDLGTAGALQGSDPTRVIVVRV